MDVPIDEEGYGMPEPDSPFWVVPDMRGFRQPPPAITMRSDSVAGSVHWRIGLFDWSVMHIVFEQSVMYDNVVGLFFQWVSDPRGPGPDMGAVALRQHFEASRRRILQHMQDRMGWPQRCMTHC